jgi:hypothetical protein
MISAHITFSTKKMAVASSKWFEDFDELVTSRITTDEFEKPMASGLDSLATAREAHYSSRRIESPIHPPQIAPTDDHHYLRRSSDEEEGDDDDYSSDDEEYYTADFTSHVYSQRDKSVSGNNNSSGRNNRGVDVIQHSNDRIKWSWNRATTTTDHNNSSNSSAELTEENIMTKAKFEKEEDRVRSISGQPHNSPVNDATTKRKLALSPDDILLRLSSLLENKGFLSYLSLYIYL